ncbi:Response regulator [Pandoraea horticolens]|uniref:Response regulator n=1 Tax=Pandoraea horticolens TaxID=2508298 RepID=A0A5E4XQL2_9BURK|nr:helix-turn-helix domain-containing protein [Pandoraea horticolens]VVE38637.1 Response regulator [Pandoraea horticolens]
MQLQSQSERYVMVDGGIGHITSIKDGVRLSGVSLRVVRSVEEALRGCASDELPDLVLIGVRDSNVDAISGCRDVLRQHDASIIAFGPAQAPALRVRCFRAGAVDYIDTDASPKELDLRIGMHLRARPEFAVAPASRNSLDITGSRKQEIYRLAVKYLAQTEIGNISQQVLASRIGVSVGHLDAAFRSVLGCSIVRFLKRRRIDLATVLLKGSDMSVTAIAELLGFCDGANFATAFRQDVGQSPSEYRCASSGECQSGSGLRAKDWRTEKSAPQGRALGYAGATP